MSIFTSLHCIISCLSSLHFTVLYHGLSSLHFTVLYHVYLHFTSLYYIMSIYPLIKLSFQQFIYSLIDNLTTKRSIYKYILLSIHPFIHPSFYLSIYPFYPLSYLSIHLTFDHSILIILKILLPSN